MPIRISPLGASLSLCPASRSHRGEYYMFTLLCSPIIMIINSHVFLTQLLLLQILPENRPGVVEGSRRASLHYRSDTNHMYLFKLMAIFSERFGQSAWARNIYRVRWTDIYLYVRWLRGSFFCIEGGAAMRYPSQMHLLHQLSIYSMPRRFGLYWVPRITPCKQNGLKPTNSQLLTTCIFHLAASP